MPERRLRLVDLHRRVIHPALIAIEGDRIASIEPLPESAPLEPGFILPGFVDAHVHIESSMLPPAEFARVAVRHGTVATVSDPHEIANVLGEEGVAFMLEEASRACMPIAFGAPSCVPATSFEQAGATLDLEAVERLLADPRIPYLSEMMNWPGVLSGDPEVMAKIAAAKRLGKPIDGHAPGLRGADAQRYADAGISTDHECFTLEEAREKIAAGMKVLIREGSAARNHDALWPIVHEHPDRVMLCTDDTHPDALVQGHLDRIVARCLANGLDLFDVLRAACIAPVEHYALSTGLLRAGDRADFIVVDDLDSFRVRETWIAGRCVAREGRSLVEATTPATPNRFRDARFDPMDFALRVDREGPRTVRAIEVEDGEIVTGETSARIAPRDGILEPDPASDTLLLTVCNRYEVAPPALAFVRRIGLRHGAIASSVAHDSHNVVAAGADRDSISAAVNAVFAAKGGLAVAHPGGVDVLPLPIAGLMSDRPAEEVAAAYERLTSIAQSLGSPLQAPFMTLSFLALLVIPALKLGDRGLFDARAFRFVPAIAD
ncbi:MAG: adenine deaminase [Phycisphaerales bacterium]